MGLGMGVYSVDRGRKKAKISTAQWRAERPCQDSFDDLEGVLCLETLSNSAMIAVVVSSIGATVENVCQSDVLKVAY